MPARFTDRDLICHGIKCFGFLIPRNTEWTSTRFADEIDGYCLDPRATAIAVVVRRHPARLLASHQGVRITFENGVPV